MLPDRVAGVDRLPCHVIVAFYPPNAELVAPADCTVDDRPSVSDFKYFIGITFSRF